MFYKDNEHNERFFALLKKYHKIFPSGKVDPEYATAYYLLTGNPYVWAKAKKYVDEDGIDFCAMLENTVFSSGESLIVKLAANLFNGDFYNEISPLDFISILDDEHFKMIMEAIELRKIGGKLTLDYLEGCTGS